MDTKWQKGHTPWNKGKKDVQKAWNKGLTKATDERVAKAASTQALNYSDSHRAINAENCRKRRGQKIPADILERKLSREYLTKKRNNSFNKSSCEDFTYNKLLEIYPNKTIYKQYKCEKYPFYCDFYIVEDDLFIEVNAHWTHGGKPYDPNDSECKEKLAIWAEKAKTSQFYQNAIETWTIRDVKKLKWAKEHNLNYKVIYDIKE